MALSLVEVICSTAADTSSHVEKNYQSQYPET
jgi:hypothetical protein